MTDLPAPRSIEVAGSIELDYSLDLTGWQEMFERLHALTAAAVVDQLLARMDPAPVVCPECSAGKCGNCDGGAWDHELDVPTACLCLHPKGSL